MTGITYGILAMFGWGVGEFTAKKAVDEYGEHKAYLYVQAIGALIATLIAYFYGQLRAELFTLPLLGLSLLIGATYSIAYLNAFKAYRIGKLAIVSPILCSYGMLSSILAAIFLNQTLSFLQFIGIIVIISGTFLLSLDFEELRKSFKFTAYPGVKEAIITFLFFGINSVLLDFTVVESNLHLVNTLNSIFSLFTIATIFVYFSKSNKTTHTSSVTKNGIVFMIATAILTALANLWFIIGYSRGDSILIAPIGASSGVVTSILSFIFLKEKLTKIQLVGMISTFIGIILISL